RMDDVFVSAAAAQSLGGERPYITPQALPSSMTIPVTWDKVADGSSNTNLTVWKIEEALQRMAVNEVDLDREMTCIAISPRMKQAWLFYAMNSPNDIFAQMIAEWRMDPSKGIMGCKVIVTNRLVTQAGLVQALVFTKRAFRLPPTNYEIKIDELPDKRHSLQMAAYARTGCLRRYDELVQLIWCDPSKAIADFN
ncbi:MAG TPA: phage capsid protein, partial [Verrucomicrobiales bacterium]|nr:phage capsid protein [Verrucomicrobiales bacterium]